ncbi:hypothetical protein B6D29_04595 [Microgenomates bacterium UTCPR1]|nr:MAG: hypothetical protein B6D29_04595 [Microgenomates bacterium UTCPR1]
MEREMWTTIAKIFFISNTLGIIILIETLIYDKPFISLFLLIFALVYGLNKQKYDRGLRVPR